MGGPGKGNLGESIGLNRPGLFGPGQNRPGLDKTGQSRTGLSGTRTGQTRSHPPVGWTVLPGHPTVANDNVHALKWLAVVARDLTGGSGGSDFPHGRYW